MIELIDKVVWIYDHRPGLLAGAAIFVILTLWSCVWLNRHLSKK